MGGRSKRISGWAPYGVKRKPDKDHLGLGNFLTNRDMWQMSAQEVANDYRNQEFATMIIRGSRERGYVPDWLKENTTTIDGRILYTMGYRTVGEPFGGLNGHAILYLYFPTTSRKITGITSFLCNPRPRWQLDEPGGLHVDPTRDQQLTTASKLF